MHVCQKFIYEVQRVYACSCCRVHLNELSIVFCFFSDYYVQMFQRTGPDSDTFDVLSAAYCKNHTLCTLKEFEEYVC